MAQSRDGVMHLYQLKQDQRRARRGLVEMGNVFVPKGQWIFGGTASYSTHDNDKYKLLLLEDVTSQATL